MPCSISFVAALALAAPNLTSSNPIPDPPQDAFYVRRCISKRQVQLQAIYLTITCPGSLLSPDFLCVHLRFLREWLCRLGCDLWRVTTYTVQLQLITSLLLISRCAQPVVACYYNRLLTRTTHACLVRMWCIFSRWQQIPHTNAWPPACAEIPILREIPITWRHPTSHSDMRTSKIYRERL